MIVDLRRSIVRDRHVETILSLAAAIITGLSWRHEMRRPQELTSMTTVLFGCSALNILVPFTGSR